MLATAELGYFVCLDVVIQLVSGQRVFFHGISHRNKLYILGRLGALGHIKVVLGIKDLRTFFALRNTNFGD